MKANRKVCTIAAALMAGYMAVSTASAQTYMVFEYGASAGAVSQVSIANLAPNWVVTGVRNSLDAMEVITWESNGTALTRKGSASSTGTFMNAGVSTAALSSSLVITAGISSNGLEELMSWSISPTGAVTFLSSVTGDSAKTVRMTKLDSTRVMTAIQNTSGDLIVEVWSASSSGAISYRGSAIGAAASIATIAVLSSTQVVTAIRNSAGDLQLDSWSVAASDNVIGHQATNSAGAIKQVDITAWADTGHIATPVSNSSGKLEVIDWIVNSTTGAIKRESSFTAGVASQVAASTIGTLVFTGSINSNNKVAAGVWGYNGSQIGQAATAQDEIATAISAAPLSTGPYTVTASCTKAGDLQLDVWNYFSIQ